MRYLSLALVAAVAICAPTFAQCSTLAVTGSINPGQTVTIDVSGAPAGAPVFIVIGDAGTTTFPFGLTLDVAPLIAVLPIGVADAGGHVALSASIPAEVPASALPDHTYTLQAVSLSISMGFPPSISFCVSNTGSLVSGAG